MIKAAIERSLPEGAKLVTPPNPAMGDIAVELFHLAKARQTSPVTIANELKPTIQCLDGVLSADVAGPYLNVKLDRAFMIESLLSAYTDGSLYHVDIGYGRHALIEHTSINPNASPHIGRARNAIIGDSISRILRFVGYDLDVHYYVNDMGKQIAMLALACKDDPNVSFDDILGIYVEASTRLKEDSSYEQEVFEYLKKFEEGDSQVQKEFHFIVDKCVVGQSNILKGINISYDTFDYESSFVHDEELDKLISKLQDDGIAFVDEHDRLVVDLQKIGFLREEGRYYVIKRANGSTMYGYRDIAYHIYKARQCPDPETGFVILGEDHKLYFEQLSLLLKHFGYTPPKVIHYSFISLKDSKMSTRQGNVVLLEDFLEEVKGKVAERFTKGSDNADAIQRIAIGAVRFNIIKVKPNSSITFDWDAALSLEGDTCPYVQYSCEPAIPGEAILLPLSNPGVVH